MLAMTAAMALLAGCQGQDPTPGPTSPEELWQQGQVALQAEQFDQGARMLAESLTRAENIDRRREAAMRLAGAGRLDLAEGFLHNQSSPELMRLARAMKLYQASPPRGHEANPYIISGMAEAMMTQETPAELTDVPQPIRFSGEQLGVILHNWLTWVHFSQQELAATTGPAEDDDDGSADREPAGRAMALWVIRGANDLRTAPRHYIAHGLEDAHDPTTLAYLGSWLLARDGPTFDAVSLADDCSAGEVELRLHAWRGSQPLATLVLTGELADGGLVIRRTSDARQYEALLGMFGDEQIAPGRVTPKSAEEQTEILQLAQRMGLSERLVAEDGALVAPTADRGETDYAPTGQWLADVAGYIRYGRAAIRH